MDSQLYTYDLPDERIAKYPLAERDASKLLVYRNGSIEESVFRNVGSFLPDGAMLVFNNTKVIRARLAMHKATGANIEVFCLEPILPSDVQQAFAVTDVTEWKCIVGNSKKWKEGLITHSLTINGNEVILSAERISTADNTSVVRFTWSNSNYTFAEIIEHAGVTPIPPYLNRETEEIDNTRYQTVYSEHKGSVAAPTAGLHFTERVLSEIRANGHELVNLTLHVGAGTFKPIQTADVKDHVMHAEQIYATKPDIQAILNNSRAGKKLVAVGTTSVRTLESLYWLGVKCLQGESVDFLAQWDAYNLPQSVSLPDSFGALLDYMDKNDLDSFHSSTQIMIVPGYTLRVVDGLITNFHQPHSTLLLLISAVVGEKWHDIYDYALSHDFRFLSYGDSSLLMRG
ncbi:MAG: S-adenosylmethionine:tRNA ribosyltransferase-isomerase [Bacteroidales bacterium]|nr:S-adenosylmethionine:tRNA ribosyltransferase-isomerase [Bacteroidales bacterium]